MKTLASCAWSVWLLGMGAWAVAGCTKEPQQPGPEAIAAAEKAAYERAVAEKAAEAEGAEQAAAEKAAEAIAAAEEAAYQKGVADKAAEEKAEAERAAALEAAEAKAAAQQRAEAAALPADLVVMKSEVSRVLSQIDLTMAKLEALASSKGSLEKPTQDAIDAIEALDTEAKVVMARGNDMRNRGAAYFEAWEKQLAAMSTPEVVAIATKRKDELAAKYAEVLTSMQESRAAFDPFWADLQAIHQALDEGMTPETLESIAPRIKAVKGKTTTLKSRVEATSAKLDQVSALYTTR